MDIVCHTLKENNGLVAPQKDTFVLMKGFNNIGQRWTSEEANKSESTSVLTVSSKQSNERILSAHIEHLNFSELLFGAYIFHFDSRQAHAPQLLLLGISLSSRDYGPQGTEHATPQNGICLRDAKSKPSHHCRYRRI